MVRWAPNAQERLAKAALELFRERGYDDTTVQEIAARAGLTERTFFRYFADKREVLFGGSQALTDFIVEHIAKAPTTLGPLDAVVSALEATSASFEERRSHARKRQALIGKHPELREREALKMASLAVAAADALRARGLDASVASLAAETGVAIFKGAFERWLEDKAKRDLAHHVRATFATLRGLTGGGV